MKVSSSRAHRNGEDGVACAMALPEIAALNLFLVPEMAIWAAFDLKDLLPCRTAAARLCDRSQEFSVRGGFATDYIYRGTTVSARQPAVGAAFEAAFAVFYAGSTIASVKLPSQPAAEITMAGGIRPKLWDINFDFRWTYFSYPGETPPPGVFAGIEYWEYASRAPFPKLPRSILSSIRSDLCSVPATRFSPTAMSWSPARQHNERDARGTSEQTPPWATTSAYFELLTEDEMKGYKLEARNTRNKT